MNINISVARYQHLRENYEGICIACGAVRDECEPDAEAYECDSCGEHKVFGIEQALLLGHVCISEDDA